MAPQKTPKTPTPAPIEPGKVPELALEVIQRAKFPMLATVDGDQPHLRPVSPVRTEGFTVFIANLRPYGKTNQIALNPKVELCYLDDAHDQVRITGTAEVLADPKTKLLNHLTCTLRDITALRDAEAATKRELRFREAIETSLAAGIAAPMCFRQATSRS